MRRLLFAATLAAVFACIGPATSAWLDRSTRAASAMPAPVFTAAAGCRPTSTAAFAMAPDMASQRFVCAAGQLTVTVQAFPPRSNPARVITAQRRATGEASGSDETVVSSLQVPGIQPGNWRLVLTGEPARVTAAALWIDGKPATGGLAGRLTMARNSVAGSAYAPMLVTVAMQFPHPQLTSNDEQFAQRLIRAFLTAQGKLSDQMTQLAMAAAR